MSSVRGQSDWPQLELATIRTLLVRIVACIALPFAALVLAVDALTDSDLRVWAVTSSVVFLTAGAQLWMKKPHPPILIAVTSTALFIGTAVAGNDAAPAIAAGVLAVGLPITMVFAASTRSIPYVVWIAAMTGLASWWDHRNWPSIVGLGGLLIGVAVGWVVLRAASEELGKAERRYRRLFESAGDGLIAIDADHRIILANEKACRALGTAPEQLSGLHVSSVLPDCEQISAIVHASDARAIATMGRRADGTEFPIELSAAMLEADGESLCLASIHDISDRVRAEHRALRGERVYRDLFESVPIGLYRTSPSGEILDANPALADILGFDDLNDLLGINAKEIFLEGSDRDRQMEALETSQGAVRSEIRLRRRDGQIIWVRDRARAIRDLRGRTVLYEGAIQDATDEHRAMARLEQEIRSKTELVASVSHELRTPLTAVLGFIDLLLQEAPVGSPEGAEYLNLASQQANELALLIEDLLTSAHIEHDELVVTPASVDLWESVVTAIDALGSRADADIVSTVNPGLTAWCDSARVRQIIRNLISNALAHGAPPIHVSGGKSDDRTIEIVVADHGEGIRTDMSDQIFEAFFRGHDAKTRPGSIGLGLAVSRRLARMMHGDLTYRRRGDTTEFVLRLPATALGEGTGSEAAVA